jgi:glycine cleavage system H protein
MEEKGMSVIPAELKYSKTHEWVKEEDGLFVIGLTDYAQSELGDIVFINLPEEGDEVSVGEAFSDVESVKAVSDVYSPVSGIVAEINEELQDNPALVNEDPYGAWLIKVRGVTEQEELLDAAGYEKVVAEEEA